MSDTEKSVEDFFSKKKAKKGKSKFTTSDTITKQVGGSGQKEKDKSKEQKSSAVQQGPAAKESEEWIDFEEPTEKDYSGLRIQSLQIFREKTEAETTDTNEQDPDDDEGETSAKEKTTGPWQKQQSQPAQAAPETVEEKPKTAGVYRPPSYRTSAARRPGSSQRAPELNNEFAFPTLQAAASGNKGKESPVSGKNFEPVRHGSRTMDNPADRRPRLDLENKFDALSRS